jgi:hypothetical protein
MCWIHDGQNGVAGTHGSLNLYKVQIISHKGITCNLFILKKIQASAPEIVWVRVNLN